VQPEGVASGDAIRFDVNAGRWEPDYSVFVNRAGRRQGNLILDVQPYGYLPTMMILASTASVALPANLALSAVPGDVPAQAVVAVRPNQPAATQYRLGASYVTDGLAWGFAGSPSFMPFLSGGSFLYNSGPPGDIVLQNVARASSLYTPDQWAGSWALGAGLGGGWVQGANYLLSSALAPAYRARFNAYAWLRIPAGTYQFQALLDVVPQDYSGARQMASANLVATVPLQNGNQTPEPLFSIVPLGPINLPGAASGIEGPQTLRLWLNLPTAIASAPSASTGQQPVTFGGLFLQPIAPGAGVLPRGLQIPSTLTFGKASGYGLDLSSIDSRQLLYSPPSTVAGQAADYRGQLPYIGASISSINIAGLPRPGRHFEYQHEVEADSPDYFYRFVSSSGYPTVLDSSFNARQGSWIGSFTGDSGTLVTGRSRSPYIPLNNDQQYGVWNYTTVGSDSAVASVDLSGRSFTIELWASDLRLSGQQATPANLVAWGGSHATARHLQLGWSPSNTHMFSFGPGDQIGATLNAPGASANLEASWHHLAAVFDATANYMALYRDATMVASRRPATSLRSGGANLLFIGKDSIGAASGYAIGQFGDLAVWLDRALTGSRIAAHFNAGVSGIAATTGLYAEAYPQSAAVSVRARPRFQLLKGV
jgi:hypothetical protein